MKNKMQLIIHFLDGNKICFDFPEQTDPENIAHYGENLLKDQHISIEADGSIFIYPLQNIKSLQVYPSPKILPANIIRGAHVIEED